MKKIQVFVIDDSAVVRQVLQTALTQDPNIAVLATAHDPIFAWDRMQRQWPDVVILDIEMPRMDGVTFLRKIMAEHPLPVIICSSLAESGAQITLNALSAGAVQIIQKPHSGLRDFLQKDAPEIIQAVKAAARANLRNIRPAPVRFASPRSL